MFKDYLEALTSKEQELVQRAQEFAKKAHAGAVRKSSGLPYYTHPKAVAQLVEKVKHSHRIADLIAAAYLHDTVEDTEVSVEEIKLKFGDLVANLVDELTSKPEDLKKYGKTRSLINKMLQMSSWGLVIKLADRWHNTTDLTSTPPEFTKRYRDETLEILKALNQRKLSGTQTKIVSMIERNLQKTIKEL